MIENQRFGRQAVYFLIMVLCVFLTSAPAFATKDMFSDYGSPAEETSQTQVMASQVFSVTSAAPGKSYPAAIIAEMTPGWHINSARPTQDWMIAANISFDPVNGLTPHAVVYPDGKPMVLAGETMSVYDGKAIIKFLISVDKDLTPGTYTLPVKFTYQPCNDKECKPPRTDELAVTVNVGAEGKRINPEVFSDTDFEATPPTAQSLDGAEAAAATDSELQRLIDQYGFWGYFLALGLAFVTGLLLSFSPCTYPMIPITVSVFAGQQRSLGRGFIMSLFYVGSMAVVYGIMGLIVSLVGGVFGAWLASPPVVIGIAIVFVIFALSMFGVYELQVPSSLRNKLGSTKAKGGVGGAILLGIVAALVVSPCVGPFVAGILLYIATYGSPLFGFLVLFVFALGLGTLYLIIGTFSSAINALPGAGGWMETVKKFFGFVLLLMALYFLKTIIPETVTAILMGLLLLALGVFGGGLDRLTPESPFFLRLKKYVGILALIVGVYLIGGTLLSQGLILPAASQWLPVSAGGAPPEEKSLIAWETDLESGLNKAKAENKPVIIDTWATWCINCKVLEKKTFGKDEVAAEAERFVPIKVQLETADSPEAKKFLERFGLKHYSLPTTLILDSKGKVLKILQGAVGPEEMIAEMQRAR